MYSVDTIVFFERNKVLINRTTIKLLYKIFYIKYFNIHFTKNMLKSIST